MQPFFLPMILYKLSVTFRVVSFSVEAALSTAEGLAREHIAKFNASGDKRSEAVLLLAAGEINYNKRGAVLSI